uniref:Alginate lyase 2 domain-containing protein n=1 Tax=Kalanchoe fedtschenkoi TaxID=63787 RepID=A0A7N0T9L8_KALFE
MADATFSPSAPFPHFLILASLPASLAAATTDDNKLGYASNVLEQIQSCHSKTIRRGCSCEAHGVHKLWVFATDKPHSPASHTHPRTEIRIKGYDYSSGVWQFEAYGYVPRKTSGVCIMQVFGARPPHATTLMLRVYDGSLSYYNKPVLVPHIYDDTWFKLNVIHDIERKNVRVYIYNELKFEVPGREAASHYFKCGVYGQDYSSHRMESRWKNIKVLRKRS